MRLTWMGQMYSQKGETEESQTEGSMCTADLTTKGAMWKLWEKLNFANSRELGRGPEPQMTKVVTAHILISAP